MKQLACVSIFVIVCILTAYAKPYPLYTFEDDAMRRITIRFIGDSTVTVSNKECMNGLRCETQISFTDEYHYKWVGDRKVQLRLQNTDRKDMGVKSKYILPLKMNSSIDVESSKQIFPILANGYICFSEDFSMLRFEDFLFEKTDSVKWITDTNLVSPLLYAQLGLMPYVGKSYTYSDRKERNLSFDFLDKETIVIKNVDKNGGKYNFVDIYKVKHKKGLFDYTIVNLKSTTRQERQKGNVIPALCNCDINCCDDVFPIFKNESIYFNINYCLLQIGQFTFKYYEKLIPLG